VERGRLFCAIQDLNKCVHGQALDTD